MNCYRCSKWPCECKDGQTIIHGDCREVLPELGPVDLVLTDPPYGIDESSAKVTSRQRKANGRSKALADQNDYGDFFWDSDICQDGLDAAQALSRWQIIFGGNFYDLGRASCWLVWDKDNGANDFADCELAWTNFKKAVRKFRWRWNGMLQEHGGARKEFRQHPTQKPIALMKWCIGHAPKAETILDPFMGSGTTLRAAKDLGRRCTGIEIEERYCEIAAERLRQEVLF